MGVMIRIPSPLRRITGGQDRVEVEVPGIGILENSIVSEEV